MENEETDLDFKLIAGARQVIPPETAEDALDQEGPLYLTWFALGHVAVLTYLVAHALHSWTAKDQLLLWSAVAVLGISLWLLLRAKLRAAASV